MHQEGMRKRLMMICCSAHDKMVSWDNDFVLYGVKFLKDFWNCIHCGNLDLCFGRNRNTLRNWGWSIYSRNYQSLVGNTATVLSSFNCGHWLARWKWKYDLPAISPAMVIVQLLLQLELNTVIFIVSDLMGSERLMNHLKVVSLKQFLWKYPATMKFGFQIP